MQMMSMLLIACVFGMFSDRLAGTLWDFEYILTGRHVVQSSRNAKCTARFMSSHVDLQNCSPS